MGTPAERLALIQASLDLGRLPKGAFVVEVLIKTREASVHSLISPSDFEKIPLHLLTSLMGFGGIP